MIHQTTVLDISKGAVRRTPVALAIVSMCTYASAQTAVNTTSADTLEAKSLFETSGQAAIGPRPFTSFLNRLSTPVEKIKIKAAADNLLADRITGTEVSVQLFDTKGNLLKGEQEVTIEVTGGARVLLPGRLTLSLWRRPWRYRPYYSRSSG